MAQVSNRLRIRNGRIRRGPSGDAEITTRQLDAVAATITLTPVLSSDGLSEGRIRIASDAAATFLIVFSGPSGIRSWFVDFDAAGEQNLGVFSRVLGRRLVADEPSAISWRIAPVEIVGGDRVIGPLGPAEPLVPAEPTPDARLPDVHSAGISGTGETGTAHTVVYDADLGYPEAVATFIHYLDDEEVVGETGDDFTPAAGDHGKLLTSKVTLTNASGTDEVTTAPILLFTNKAAVFTSSTISGTGVVGEPLVANYVLADPGYPVAAITRQWTNENVDIVGATGASYVVLLADDGDDIRCVTTATNSTGAVTSTSDPITATTGAPPDVAPVIGDDGVIAPLASAGAGVLHTLTPPTVTGSPTPSVTRAWYLGASAVSGQTGLTYTSPLFSSAEVKCRVTATNTAGSVQKDISAGVAVPHAVVSADWAYRTVTNPTASSARVDELDVYLEDIGAARWTTAAAELTPDQITALGQFETMTVGNYVGGKRILTLARMSPTDFTVFDPIARKGDRERGGRFRIQLQDRAGNWGPLSDIKPVAIPEGTKIVEGDHIPMIGRSKKQYDAGIAGGGGYQFFRGWGYSPAAPDLLFGVQDICTPIRTRDFGAWWDHPMCTGLKVGVTGAGAGIDPDDPNRVLVIYSAGSLRGATPNGWDAYSGISLSTDQGDSFTLAEQIDHVAGSASNDADETTVRYQHYPFVYMPLTGGQTPAERTIRCVVHRMPKDGTTIDTQLYESTNGGASWTLIGALAAATYGHVVGLRFDGTYWWVWGSLGLWRNTSFAATGWSKRTSGMGFAASGRVTKVECFGSTIFASVRLDGLYKSTNSGGAWTRLYQYRIETFAVSPHDNQRILVAGAKKIGTIDRSLPMITTNGGSSWSEITTRAFAGQPEGFQSLIQDTHAEFIWHAVKPNVVFAHRFQHFGTSSDSGASFDWSSNNFDYNYVQAIATDPTAANWKQLFVSMTDRVCAFSDTGYEWIWDDGVTDERKNELEAKLSTTQHLGAGRGAMILRNSTHVLRIAALGHNNTRALFRTFAANETIDGVVVSNPILGCSTDPPYYGGQFCITGVRASASVGYIGRTKVTLASNGAITYKDMGKEIVAVGSDGRVYATNKGAGDKTIWRCLDPTAGTLAWTAWLVLADEPRPFDDEPCAISYDPAHLGKLFIGTRNGKFVLAYQDGASVTQRVVATASSLVGGSWPNGSAQAGYSTAMDNLTGAAYLTLNRYGGPMAFKTSDLMATPSVSWTDITGYRGNMSPSPHRVYTHPGTGDVFFSGHHGTTCYPPHVRITNKSIYYDCVLPALRKAQV